MRRWMALLAVIACARIATASTSPKLHLDGSAAEEAVLHPKLHLDELGGGDGVDHLRMGALGTAACVGGIAIGAGTMVAAPILEAINESASTLNGESAAAIARDRTSTGVVMAVGLVVAAASTYFLVASATGLWPYAGAPQPTQASADEPATNAVSKFALVSAPTPLLEVPVVSSKF